MRIRPTTLIAFLTLWALAGCAEDTAGPVPDQPQLLAKRGGNPRPQPPRRDLVGNVNNWNGGRHLIAWLDGTEWVGARSPGSEPGLTQVYLGRGYPYFPTGLDNLAALTDLRLRVKPLAGSLLADSYLQVALRLDPYPPCGNCGGCTDANTGVTYPACRYASAYAPLDRLLQAGARLPDGWVQLPNAASDATGPVWNGKDCTATPGVGGPGPDNLTFSELLGVCTDPTLPGSVAEMSGIVLFLPGSDDALVDDLFVNGHVWNVDPYVSATPATVLPGRPVTVKGRVYYTDPQGYFAHDCPGYWDYCNFIGGVEVSLDGGATWMPGDGFTTDDPAYDAYYPNQLIDDKGWNSGQEEVSGTIRAPEGIGTYELCLRAVTYGSSGAGPGLMNAPLTGMQNAAVCTGLTVGKSKRP